MGFKLLLRMVFVVGLLGVWSGQAAVAAPQKTVKKTAVPKAKMSANKSTAKKSSEKKANEDQDAMGGLYVFVDEEGVPHYALQKLDERYVLFSNAGPVMDSDIKLKVGMPEKTIGKAYYADVESGLYGNVAKQVTYYAPQAAYGVSKRLLNNPNLARYESLIRRHASTHGVDVNLIKAVMAAESGFNATALSNKNAMGLMQVIPPTAARYGVSADQLMIPERNIYAGVRYLRDLSRMFRGQPELIIAAYNAGEGAVYKYNRRIPPYAETQNYVRKVMQYYGVFAGSGAVMSNPVYVVPKARGRVSVKVGAPAALDMNSRRKMQKI